MRIKVTARNHRRFVAVAIPKLRVPCAPRARVESGGFPILGRRSRAAVIPPLGVSPNENCFCGIYPRRNQQGANKQKRLNQSRSGTPNLHKSFRIKQQHTIAGCLRNAFFSNLTRRLPSIKQQNRDRGYAQAADERVKVIGRRRMVEPRGFAPLTPTMPLWCSTN